MRDHTGRIDYKRTLEVYSQVIATSPQLLASVWLDEAKVGRSDACLHDFMGSGSFADLGADPDNPLVVSTAMMVLQDLCVTFC